MLKKMNEVLTYEYASVNKKNLFVSLLTSFADNFIVYSIIVAVVCAVRILILGNFGYTFLKKEGAFWG